MVSVIIPTYKGSAQLQRAISSVLTQTYKDCEVIVVDDNAPDSEERKKTESILTFYDGDKRVRYIKHAQNLNGAVARNTGISHAKGEYIAFLDDDDYYLPSRIQKSVDFLQNNANAIGVYTGVDVVDENDNVNLQIRPKCDLSIPDLLQKEMVIGTGSNIFVKRDVVRKVGGFDKSFVRRQDTEFMIRVCHEGRIGALSEKLIVKSVNGTLNHPKYERMKLVIDQFSKKFASEIEGLGDQKAQYYSTQYRTLFYIALFEHNTNEINEATQLINRYRKLTIKEKILRIIYIYNLRDNVFVKGLIRMLKRG